MKKISNILLLLTLLFTGASVLAQESVNWTGILNESEGYHFIGHKFGHDLQFVRQSDGKKFSVINSEELEELHGNIEKNLLIKITAEITPKFLFWGGNLVVQDFKVVAELDQIPHKKYEKPSSADFNSDRHNR